MKMMDWNERIWNILENQEDSSELQRLFKKYYSDKGINGYTPFYEQLFKDKLNDSMNILEIGIQLFVAHQKNANQTSLGIWKEYLPNSSITGIDIRDYSSNDDIDRIKIYQADQSSVESLIKFKGTESAVFDVIIDDGSHISSHQQLTLETLFPMVKQGCSYVIEDLNLTFKEDLIERKIRTIDLLKLWKNGNWENYGMDEKRFEYLKNNINAIEFHCNDWLACVSKKA